jgi:tetratricopeptide (TPR) repeat protein
VDDARPTTTTPTPEPPRGPPAGPQLAPDALESTLTEAVALVDAGQLTAASELLATCANKQPASPRCDARLGMVLAGLRTRTPEARDFLDRGALRDDPRADVEFYREFAKVARRAGRHEAAAHALEWALQRPGAHLHDWIALSEAWQAADGEVQHAIDALAHAIELAPDRADLLLDHATLLAQTSSTADAIVAYERYLEVAEPSDPMAEVARARIPRLREQLAATGNDDESAGPPATETSP